MDSFMTLAVSLMNAQTRASVEFGTHYGWRSDHCDCDECIQLKEVEEYLNTKLSLDSSTAMVGIITAKDVITSARKELHMKHKPEYHAREKIDARGILVFLNEERSTTTSLEHTDESDTLHIQANAGIESSTADSAESDDDRSSEGYGGWGRKPDDESENDDRKFMVCDHCRGHALPCNEDAVCEQCELSGTVCVHRWCGHNRGKIRAHCDKYACRYAHKDHLPTDSSKYSQEDYIILPGFLRDYMADGQGPPLEAPSHPDIFGTASLAAKCCLRQKEGRKEIQRMVRDGEGPLHKVELPCGPNCGKHLSEDEVDDGEGAPYRPCKVQ